MTGPQGPVEPIVRAERPIDPNLRIGHVHLRTADIDRVRDFYVGILGFDVVFEGRDVPGWGTTGDILFISAGGYHRRSRRETRRYSHSHGHGHGHGQQKQSAIHELSSHLHPPRTGQGHRCGEERRNESVTEATVTGLPMRRMCATRLAEQPTLPRSWQMIQGGGHPAGRSGANSPRSHALAPEPARGKCLSLGVTKSY